jgi:hypothetical protein
MRPLPNLRLNWKLISVHLLAIYCIRQGFFQLSYLTAIDYLEAMRNDTLSEWSTASIASDRHNLLNNIGLFTIAGMLSGFLLSLYVSLRLKWYWVNSLIAFLLLIALTKLLPFEWYSLYPVLTFIGSFFHSLLIVHISFGALFLASGGILLFHKSIQRFFMGKYLLVPEASFQFEEPAVKL